jgi:sugar phosphate isomerase/epimerase
MDRDRLSFNSGNMVGSVADKIAAAHEAGFADMTLWPADFFVHFEDLDANIDFARASPMRHHAYMMVRDLEGSPAEVKARKMALANHMMDQMEFVGATTLVQCSNIGPDPDRDWSKAVEDLRRLAELAVSRGKRIAFEPMSQGSWINTYMLGWQMVRDVDHAAFGMVLDASHVFLSEAPLHHIDEISPEKIFLCELADFPAASLDRREMLRNYRLFPGEGIRPVREFVERVLGIGYSGVFSAEVFNARYRAADPKWVAKRGYQAMEQLFARELG